MADKKAHVLSRQVIIRDVRFTGRTAEPLDRLQTVIPIVDAAIPVLTNGSDIVSYSDAILLLSLMCSSMTPILAELRSELTSAF